MGDGLSFSAVKPKTADFILALFWAYRPTCQPTIQEAKFAHHFNSKP